MASMLRAAEAGAARMNEYALELRVMCVRRRVANGSTATCAEHALVNGVCAVM